MPFADYLALRWTSWWYLLIGVVGLVVLVMGWERCRSRWDARLGRIHGDVLKSARAEGALWLLVIAFCVVAPITEEFLRAGFSIAGGRSRSCGPPVPSCCRRWCGPRCTCNMTGSFFGEVFSIGLLFGYLRYRSDSIWLTVILHGLNNLAATLDLWCRPYGPEPVR